MKTFDPESIPETMNALPGSRDDRDALIVVGRREVRGTSFKDLGDRVGRLAEGLRADGNDSSGDHREKVMLFAPASADSITAALGILRAGKVVVPVDTQISDEDLVRVLKNLEPRRVLTTQRLAKRLHELENMPTRPECFALDADEEGETESWEVLMRESGGDAAKVDPDDIAVLFYTSGTTGPPKGVPLSHRNLFVQLETVLRSELIGSDDRMLLPLPLHHVYPFVIGMLTPLAMGIPIVLPDSLTGSALTRALRAGEASVSIGVPRLYEALFNGVRERMRSIPAGEPAFDAALKLAAGCERFGLPVGRLIFRPLRRRVGPRLRLLVSGGSPLDPELARRLEAFGWGVVIGYGLTETAPLLTIKPPGKGPRNSVGRAIEAVELKLDPDALEETEQDADGERGELLAKGPNIFEGYFRMEDKTRESFTADGFFRTGDLARIDDGQVFIEGRISTRIALQGGENVDPAELEKIYAETEGVEEIGVLEDEGKLAALVVPENELLRDADPEEAASRLKKKLRERGEDLPSYQRLARVEISTHSLERTRLGKLRRHALEEAYHKVSSGEEEEKREQPAEIDALSSEDRALLEGGAARGLWDLLCERYPDRPVEPEAHLEIDLGIDSMEWVELSLSIESKVGVVVDEDLIARADRVRDLLEAVAEAAETTTDEEIGEPMENPGQALGEDDLRWAEPRGPFRTALLALLFLLMRLFLRCFFRVETKGLDRLPEGPLILAPNHASSLDAPCLGIALGLQRTRRLFWAGVTDIMFQNIVMRAISRVGQVVPVDARRSPRSSLAFVALLLDRKHPLVWFPEGRRSPHGRLQKFQPGIGMILQRCDVPVVPVHIEGAYDCLPRGRFWPRRGHIRVRFGEPCPAGELRGDEEEREPEAIAEALREKVAALAKEAEKGNGR